MLVGRTLCSRARLGAGGALSLGVPQEAAKGVVAVGNFRSWQGVATWCIPQDAA